MATLPGESPMKTQNFPGSAVEISFDVDLLDLHETDPERYPFLLESAAHDRALGRYDILFAYPETTLRLDSDFRLHGADKSNTGEFLQAFDDQWARLHGPAPAQPEFPFRGGWFVFLGYELAAQIEPRLGLLTHPGLPVAMATRIPVGIIRDHALARAWVVAEPGYAPAIDEIRADVTRLDRAGTKSGSALIDRGLVEDAPERFLNAVAATKAYIAKGDIYQANISREWSGVLSATARPAEVYRRLRQSNPAPFSGLASFDDICIISSSPERLLRWTDGRVETRPIAGTRPRESAADSEDPNRRALLSHPKERAEHVMLIDLERNDLGRICEPGSVQVDEFMVVETYSHVHHIVSNVSGRLLESTTPGTAIRAVFPGGSITGCPKVRCMEIIRELENLARGAYTGAMGYINRDGGGDLNILIRTMTTMGRELSFATGSGIVADSDPDRELEETRAKAKGLLLALESHE
jgi:anthranilate synthase component 1